VLYSCEMGWDSDWEPEALQLPVALPVTRAPMPLPDDEGCRRPPSGTDNSEPDDDVGSHVIVIDLA
jgi:hypothetical protein